MPVAQVMKNLHIWSSKQQEYTQALRRHPANHWQMSLLKAYQVDRQIKGLESGDAWLGLSALVLQMAS
jgi:DNA polymerase-3 subunit delta